jgi:hypothetical protein
MEGDADDVSAEHYDARSRTPGPSIDDDATLHAPRQPLDGSDDEVELEPPPSPQRKQRKVLSALADALAAHAPPVAPVTPLPAVQPAIEPAAVDQNVVEMAPRLEAALRKPQSADAHVPHAQEISFSVDDAAKPVYELPARAPGELPGGALANVASKLEEQLKAARRQALPAVQNELAKKDIVEFGVSHPSKVTMGLTLVVRVLVYRQEDRHLAVERALKGNDEFVSESATEVPRKTKLRIELEQLPWPVEPKSHVISWNGSVTNVAFQVLPDSAPATKAVYGRAKISTNGLVIGLASFKLMIDHSGSSASNTVFSRAPAVKRAFACYASRDRRSVLARVQRIEKVGVNVFMDVHDLRANEEFKTRIFDEIDRSDVLYLFWSRHAKRSSWVEMEWKYGLTKKGLGFIDPVPLIDPRKATPPIELAAHKHFNDWALVYRDYERRRNLWAKFRTFLSD